MDAATKKTTRLSVVIVEMMFAMLASVQRSTTKGLSQIVTPDLQPEGDLSLIFQIQNKRIANPYPLQAELGLTKWTEVAVFRGFQPDEWIFGTEVGLRRKAVDLHRDNERWRLHFDWQSGSENSSTIGFTCNVTPDFQFNPALSVSNGSNHDLRGYVFTYTFHLWGKRDVASVTTHRSAAK